MSAPDAPPDVPAAVEALAAGRDLRAVWRNELGGLTFQIDTGADREFVKWLPPGTPDDLAAEVRRLRWAARFAPVPRVLAHGRDAAGQWLHTLGLPGQSAVSERWKRDPLVAARAVGRGLRELHEALPVANCPFDWGVQSRIRLLSDSGRRTAAQLAAYLGETPPVDRLVVCHGDACAPNTLVRADGMCTGHVDLGRLGVADRWADLAVASWSTVWNYGEGYEVPLLAAYGVEPDQARIEFYRRLWSAGDATNQAAG